MNAFRRTLAIAMAGAAGALSFVAPAAAAGQISEAADCTARPPMSQVFLPWLDVMDYVASPDGGFERGAAGWSLEDGAGVVAGNESFYVGSRADHRSLAIPSGGRAISAPACVGLEYPTIRFFARASGVGLLSAMLVSVRYEEALTGLEVSIPIGAVAPTGGWRPTMIMAMAVNALGALEKDGMVPVSFEFAPLGAGSWQIDDLYIDPRRGP